MEDHDTKQISIGNPDVCRLIRRVAARGHWPITTALLLACMALEREMDSPGGVVAETPQEPPADE